MEFVYADGGRSHYFKATKVGDCATRAVANATGKDYKEVYDAINVLAQNERTGTRKRGTSNSRDGVYVGTLRKYIEGELGWVWVPKMEIGSGCTTHLRDGELPSKGAYIIRTSKHFTCIKDGKLYDTYDCSRGGDRCVYGYWRAPTSEEKQRHDDVVRQLAECKAFAKNEKERLAKEREAVKKHNEAVKRKYAKRLAEAKKKVREIERLIQKETLPMPKAKANSWAMRNFQEEGV